MSPHLPKIPISKLAPSFITLFGLCLGITSIRYALDAKWQVAAMLIIVAGLLDGIDGRLARLLNATSGFGAQLDSLADIVSFGVAPAVVMYFWSLQEIPYKGVGWAVVLIYVSCSAIRLARFNTSQSDEKKSSVYFVGVPMPLAAGFSLLPMILTFELLQGMRFSYWLVAAYMVAIGMLMISRLPVHSLKNVSIRREWVPMLMLTITIVTAGLIMEPWLVLPFIALIIFLFVGISAYKAVKANKKS